MRSIGRTQSKPQGGSVPLGDVDAELLHHRAGTKLSPERKRVLEKAKVELRHAFQR
jgi:hypothetical protein